ncbi:MAG: hypothetical protein AAGH76_17380, partial [Pseudomonadota bacterium]
MQNGHSTICIAGFPEPESDELARHLGDHYAVIQVHSFDEAVESVADVPIDLMLCEHRHDQFDAIQLFA